MKRDERQIRTENDILIGYKASYQGNPGIAIMRETNERMECRGMIYMKELEKMMESGPYLDLDDVHIGD